MRFLNEIELRCTSEGKSVRMGHRDVLRGGCDPAASSDPVCSDNLEREHGKERVLRSTNTENTIKPPSACSAQAL